MWKLRTVSIISSIGKIIGFSFLVAASRAQSNEFLPIGGPASEVNGVSAGGDVVVGRVPFGGGAVGIRWTSSGGIQEIPGSVHAWGVSGDGHVAVGDALNSMTGILEPFRWTTGGGLQLLGAPPGVTPDFTTIAYAASYDGAVVVGETKVGVGAKAFRWTADSGVELLDSTSSTLNHDAAKAVSNDGLVIVGDMFLQSSDNVAFRWTGSSGIEPLGTLSGGLGYSFAGGLSPDGAIVVGQATSPRGPQAFQWTESFGMVGLVDAASSSPYAILAPLESFAYGVTQTGDAIVGTSAAPYPYPTPGGGHAFVWTKEHGMESLHLVLEHRFGLGSELSGWRLTEARAISPDGRSIVGVGVNPSGSTQGWLVRLDRPIFVPEPSSAGLVAAGLGLLASVRRRRRDLALDAGCHGW
jgi:uncharacterized membrane protein